MESTKAKTTTAYPIRSGTYVHGVSTIEITNDKDGMVRINLVQGDSIRQGKFEMTIFGVPACHDGGGVGTNARKINPIDVVFIEEV